MKSLGDIDSPKALSNSIRVACHISCSWKWKGVMHQSLIEKASFKPFGPFLSYKCE